MSTVSPGVSAYGDITNVSGQETPAEFYRGDSVVNTPAASYTVAQLIALINAQVRVESAVTSTSIGKASR